VPAHKITTMRVHVDETLCAATGQCEMICPEVFEVGEVSRVLIPEPVPELHDPVREAEAACPTGAILVEG
jgi:ferredoxin